MYPICMVGFLLDDDAYPYGETCKPSYKKWWQNWTFRDHHHQNQADFFGFARTRCGRKKVIQKSSTP